MENYKDLEVNKIQDKYFFTDYFIIDLTDEYKINWFVDKIEKIFLSITGQLIFKFKSGHYKMLKFNNKIAKEVFELLKGLYKDKF